MLSAIYYIVHFPSIKAKINQMQSLYQRLPLVHTVFRIYEPGVISGRVKGPENDILRDSEYSRLHIL